MTEPARVLAWITPSQPWGAMDPPVLPVDRAAQSALLAVADFFIAIQACKTVDDALTLHRIIEGVAASVETASRAALEKSGQL